MKNLALALVFGLLSVGAVSAQTNQKTKVKTDGKEMKMKSETANRKGEMSAHDRKNKEHKSPEDRAKRRTEKMTSELNLTPDQATRVHALNLQKTQQMMALKERTGEQNRGAMGPEMKQINEQWENDLKAALSTEQFAKYQANKADKKAKMQDKHKGKGGKNYKK